MPQLREAKEAPGAEAPGQAGTRGQWIPPPVGLYPNSQVGGESSSGMAGSAAGKPAGKPVYENKDGFRVEDGRYAAFKADLAAFIPEKDLITDAVRTYAYGTDASFYRLLPKMVVKVQDEEQVRRLLPLAAKHGVPVTFRAAGTSLSGQAVTDSVLVKLNHGGKNWRGYEVRDGGKFVDLQPGLIGGEVNRILAAYKKKHKLEDQYKIGPDPASIDSCMIGGIVSNNSSGMCCGVKDNTYNTLQEMRVVFLDGTVLDTADPASVEAFMVSHKPLVEGIQGIARRVQSDPELVQLIRRKYSIKCTTGYSINALVDHPPDNPIEIIKRLIIGSEGTLAFVSKVTYKTVPEYSHKASAFMLFPDIHMACSAAAALKKETKVDAVELFDRASLSEGEKVEALCQLVKKLPGCPAPTASLLIECRGKDAAGLDASIKEVSDTLKRNNIKFLGTCDDYPFSKVPTEYNLYWDVRKGLIPLVGGSRPTGTSMLIEDVACPVANLADMTLDLQAMFKKYGYKDASAFGHALEGNLHLVFSQSFNTDADIEQFDGMMKEMCEIVAVKYKGSLKGEHSTGRNIAPFVEMEWGKKATDIMWEAKRLFDPEFLLNPGVILNEDPDVHKKSLKPSPPADPLVDRCIECGFCESNCPSRDLSLTPRQRITTYREISRLQAIPSRTPEDEARLQEFVSLFEYNGKATCAADGMCQEKCPVKINTGELIKKLRVKDLEGSRGAAVASSLANHFEGVSTKVPAFLNLVSAVHGVTGDGFMQAVSGAVHKVGQGYIPRWNKFMPKGAKPLPALVTNPTGAVANDRMPRKVVYVPACVTRMMGPARGDPKESDVKDSLMSVFDKGGYEVIYPKGVNTLCCGMMFSSRGFKASADAKMTDLEAAVLEASEGGKWPVVCDTSPCLKQMRESITAKELQFNLYEPLEFIDRFLKDRLEITKKPGSTVALHVPCSSKKMGLDSAFERLATACAEEVVPSGIPCCGMAGDRGMRLPELAAASLQHLNLPANCKDGYSTSRTCEMNLSQHSGIYWRSLVDLIDECSVSKSKAAAA